MESRQGDHMTGPCAGQDYVQFFWRLCSGATPSGDAMERKRIAEETVELALELAALEELATTFLVL